MQLSQYQQVANTQTLCLMFNFNELPIYSIPFISFISAKHWPYIMIVTSPNTSPLERSYTKLQMLTEKRRNRVEPANLETRYLISALDIPVKEPKEYALERQRLENS